LATIGLDNEVDRATQREEDHPHERRSTKSSPAT
jgi:hypothetical protein